MWLWALGACSFDWLGEAPYVLATGLGQARSIAPNAHGSAYVASSLGVFDVSGEGKASLVLDGDARLVSAQPGRLTVVRGDRVTWYAESETLLEQGTRSLPGLVDVQAWCSNSLLLAYDDRLEHWRPDDGEPERWGPAMRDVRAVALGAPDCTRALVLTGDKVLTVTLYDSAEVVTGLVDPVAVALDRVGRIWVVQGEPGVLARVDDGRLMPYAQRLEGVADLTFGYDGLFSPRNAYVAERDGRIEYVHVGDIP